MVAVAFGCCGDGNLNIAELRFHAPPTRYRNRETSTSATAFFPDTNSTNAHGLGTYSVQLVGRQCRCSRSPPSNDHRISDSIRRDVLRQWQAATHIQPHTTQDTTFTTATQKKRSDRQFLPGLWLQRGCANASIHILWRQLRRRNAPTYALQRLDKGDSGGQAASSDITLAPRLSPFPFSKWLRQKRRASSQFPSRNTFRWRVEDTTALTTLGCTAGWHISSESHSTQWNTAIKWATKNSFFSRCAACERGYRGREAQRICHPCSCPKNAITAEPHELNDLGPLVSSCPISRKPLRPQFWQPARTRGSFQFRAFGGSRRTRERRCLVPGSFESCR